MVQFVYQPDKNQAASELGRRLAQELEAGRRVLWLVSGGSSIGFCVKALESLRENGHLGSLSVGLIDERYGEPGHADSNWTQLLEAGFELPGAEMVPVLQGGLSLEETAAAYAGVLAQLVESADVVIGALGIGNDGHISGILPHSPAVTSEIVTSYSTETYQRITTTPAFFKHITVDYTFAYGESKLAPLERLRSADLPIDEQPAQLLKTLPEAHIHTDQHLGGNQ